MQQAAEQRKMRLKSGKGHDKRWERKMTAEHMESTLWTGKIRSEIVGGENAKWTCGRRASTNEHGKGRSDN